MTLDNLRKVSSKGLRVPSGFWNSKENIVKYVRFMEQHLNIKQLDDWNRVPVRFMIKNGGSGWLLKYEWLRVV
jgi:hypothetical protein